MDSIREKRIKKERGSTPREVLKRYYDSADNHESVIVIVKDKNDVIESESCADNDLETIGMLECVKGSVTAIQLGLYDE